MMGRREKSTASVEEEAKEREKGLRAGQDSLNEGLKKV
jgi:hypothetical protein